MNSGRPDRQEMSEKQPPWLFLSLLLGVPFAGGWLFYSERCRRRSDTRHRLDGSVPGGRDPHAPPSCHRRAARALAATPIFEGHPEKGGLHRRLSVDLCARRGPVEHGNDRGAPADFGSLRLDAASRASVPLGLHLPEIGFLGALGSSRRRCVRRRTPRLENSRPPDPPACLIGALQGRSTVAQRPSMFTKDPKSAVEKHVSNWVAWPMEERALCAPVSGGSSTTHLKEKLRVSRPPRSLLEGWVL
jgi:hypothetical protein